MVNENNNEPFSSPCYMKELKPEPDYKGAYLYLVKWIRGLPFDIDEADRKKLEELGIDYPKKYNHLEENL